MKARLSFDRGPMLRQMKCVKVSLKLNFHIFDQDILYLK
jgi:hypothetical protein